MESIFHFFEVGFVIFGSDDASFGSEGGDDGGTGSEEAIEDGVVGIGVGFDESLGD